MDLKSCSSGSRHVEPVVVLEGVVMMDIRIYTVYVCVF